MSTHPRLVLSHTERDQLFRRAEETLGNRLPPDAVAVHLESTENVYTYAMWIAFYHEWKAAGGKPSGYEGQLGQPARISDKLCAHIISTALAEYQTTDRACSWTIAGRLAVKYGVFSRAAWATRILQILEFIPEPQLYTHTDTEVKVECASPSTPQRKDSEIVDLTTPEPHVTVRDTHSPPSPGCLPLNTRKLRGSKAINYYPKAPFPMSAGWGRLSPTIAPPSTLPTPPPSSPAAPRAPSKGPKKKSRVKSSRSQPLVAPTVTAPAIGGLALEEVVRIFERCRKDILEDKMSVKILAETLARRHNGTNEAFWKDRWDDWILKIGVFGGSA